MALFKCKMCGGTLEIKNETVAECEYCGTRQTLPKLDDERRANLYDRANHFRRNNEFDKAAGIYEQILNEDNTDAEAYWSLVLCRYGIEYVEDPTTHKRVPTVNRVQFTSIFDDDNYKSALSHADGYQKTIYEAEARAINEIQKGILAISQKEEPFDVFICYKETDNSGRRTPDSVLANDLYHQLTQEGFKVFFSRTTLEDKLGSAYEPYIFAALNSAKVMVVLGTKPEYFKAVWVRNEWSRYLSLIKGGAKKVLIPAYKDMDPYDLPDEFSHLQAQDMSKLGFMQDLIRGVRKILDAAPRQQTTVVKETIVTGGNTNTAPLLRRAFMFLEDGNWDSADEYCEKVLDIDPENAEAYLGKLMAELRVRRKEELRDCKKTFDDRNNYLKVLRFGGEALRSELIGCIDHINTRNENERLEGIYSQAKREMGNAATESEYKTAAHHFESIPDYKDSAALAQECYILAEEARKNAILADARSHMGVNSISGYEEAIELLKMISGWKDADERIHICNEKIAELKVKEEAERLERERQEEIARRVAATRAKKLKKIVAISASIICAVIAIVVLVTKVIIPNNKYNNAVALMENGQYKEAKAAFEALGDYKDAEEQAHLMYECAVEAERKVLAEKAAAEKKAREEKAAAEKKAEEEQLAVEYAAAEKLVRNGEIAKAAIAFGKLGDYSDASERSFALWKELPYVHETISAGRYSTAALLQDTTAIAQGITKWGVCDVDTWKNLVAISSGNTHTVGLKNDGTVVATGYNENECCNTSNWRDIVAISAGGGHTVGLKVDGTVVAVGNDVDGSCAVSKWKDIIAISAGDSHTVGLKADGTVVAVGWNEYGQCDVDNWTDIVAIEAGTRNTVALKSDGTAVAVGDNTYGQCDISEWNNLVAICTGKNHTVGLKSDGTVLAVGSNSEKKLDVSDWKDIVAISANEFHTIGLKADGTLLAVGYNWLHVTQNGKIVERGIEGTGSCDVSSWNGIKLPD